MSIPLFLYSSEFLKNHKLLKNDDELGKYIKKILDATKAGKKVDAEATADPV